MKKSLILVGSLLLLVWLTACGGEETAQSQEGSQNDNSGQVSSTENGGDAIEITFLHVFGGDQGEVIKELVANFNESQDEVVVKDEQAQGWYDGVIERLQVLSLSDQLPEVTISGFAFNDYMQTFMPIVPAQTFIDEQGFDLTDFSEQMLDLARTNDGDLHSMPFAVSTPIIYVNKDHFDEAGIDFKAQPDSWQEVRDWAAQLSEVDDRYGIFFQMDFDTWMFQMMLDSNGGRLADVDQQQVQFHQEKGLDVLEFWTEMVFQDESYPYMNGDQAQQEFQQGNLSMMVATNGQIGRLKGNVPFELDIMLLPEGLSGTERKIPAGGANIFVMESDEEKEAAAWEFVNYVTSEEGTSIIAEKLGYMAVRESVLEEDGLLGEFLAEFSQAKVSYEQADDIVPWFNWPEDHGPRVNSVMLSEFEAAFTGQKTAEEALEDAASEVERLLGW
ncbi:ABC transporter substrate-binding protein [Halalkalibacter hemicellulosilyticus]|uniref:Glycerol-3-phosphate ABC transporter n=1 Tax=Halalkalibacter hemicellulosilyticusJCM 9152 TaxID=1236971 RepID=W4QKD3_9BACI|nr:ABC transporter substrate-binding protein [Halalkalibacter hemicellulosilyticus]GAE31809.1 glycerol-3-phosphate ABC transporter [Halalkalibacter hemicellulosilyticusJCM 9152]